MTKEEGLQRVKQLVVRFSEQLTAYKKSDYNETQTRRDFIDPFFKALGWDIDNKQGFAESYREVIHEDRVKVGKATKAPDYSFRLGGGKRLFFVEAKKPSVYIKDDLQPAYQVRRYGWSAKLNVSIITDFEEFAIYDCNKKPNPNDKPSVARVKYITYDNYEKEWDFIWDNFSKEAVLKGTFDKFIIGTANKKGTATVDKEFLLSLDQWRTLLAETISKENKQLDEDELNFVVQQTLDRIIFLRICEDRSIEPYGSLQDGIKTGDYYQNLLKEFKQADDKYNSGLFDFKKDKLSHSLSINNKTLKTIINELYYPVCPYEFSVLSVEILGSAYEQFLGKTITINDKGKAVIELKPEVRKAGGVYYTPQYIVDYIVENTIGKLTENKTPKQIEEIKIVDPACGSGSFLIGAYQFLLTWHKDYYTQNPNKKNPLTLDGNLTTSEKKKILLNNIYGVDIDTNAVEVTKLSLLLKCMEGETQASIANQMTMFKERVLPTLDENIKSGNSLIDTDYYDNQMDFGEERKIKPFSWQKAFASVFINGGFDVVIGNPPYGAVFEENQKKYFISTYKTVEGRYDNFELFIENGIKLLEKNGSLSYIIPSPFLTNLYSRKLREYLLKNCSLKEIVCFSMPVFEDPTVHTCIIIVNPKQIANGKITIKNQIDSVEKLYSNNGFQMSQNEVNESTNFAIDVYINPVSKIIIDKLQSKSDSLGEICFIRQCIKTGDDVNLVQISNTQLNEPWKKSLRGKSISRYGTVEKNVYLKYGDWLARNWKNISFYETNKIAIRETGKRITATLDMEKRYFLSSLYAIYFKIEKYNNQNDLMFLLGILNSEVANFYIKLIALNLTEGAFTKVRTNQLARLPIIKIKSEKEATQKTQIIFHVEQLLQINKDLQTTTLETHKQQIKSKIEYHEDKINQIVYQLYDLTEEEIKIVEKI